MNKIIMYIMSVGVIIGGLDRIFGNKHGYGEKFEEGFRMLGPTALSMVGIICLSNMIANGISSAISPLFYRLGIDPAMSGGVLAIDMGGYQLAMKLADNSNIGIYSGIIVAATFGCTIVFTIPVGISIIDKLDYRIFARGIIIGLASIPVTLMIGWTLCGLNIYQAVNQNFPILMLSVLLIIGLWKYPNIMIKGFNIYVKVINIVLTVGLMIGAVSYLTNYEIIKNLVPLMDAMSVVSSIGIVLLGSLPITLLIQRLFERQIAALGKLLKLDSASMTGLLAGCISPIPTLTMLKNMNNRGKLVNIAFLVSGTSVLGAHLGFTASIQPDMLVTMIVAKLSGGIVASTVALLITRE